jgi:uncharacterized protein GlcG (DUF336 family)
VSDVISKPSVGAQLAAKAIDAAVAKAGELGVAVTAAVVDESGILKAFTRQDGAPLASVELAQAKARMAAGLGYPTTALRGMAKDDAAFAPSVVGALTGVTILGGGAPISVDGAVIGAIGVSAASEEQDAEIADAGAAAAG